MCRWCFEATRASELLKEAEWQPLKRVVTARRGRGEGSKRGGGRHGRRDADAGRPTGGGGARTVEATARRSADGGAGGTATATARKEMSAATSEA